MSDDAMFSTADENFIKASSEAGFVIGEKELNQFKEYYRILLDKNKVMNLTAITDYNDVFIKHFTDSMLVGKVLSEFKAEGIKCKPLKEAVIADIGSGAGFPGVPLKICVHEAEITLIDSLNKRVGFLNELIEKLSLRGISAVHGRCEDLGRDSEYRERFDYVFSRAVAKLPVLCEYCLPFVKNDGIFIAYKAEDIEREVKDAYNAIKQLGGELISVKKTELPGTDYKRSFCIIKKIKPCPKKYPRKAGTPAKLPL